MRESILAVIPARGGSKGVPGKNIKLLYGKPLIAHVFETARASKKITKLILSTEDDRIAEVARSIGLEVPFKRPAELATDDASSISVIRHALTYFDGEGIKFDGVLSIQPTNPFTTLESIDGAIDLWRRTGCDSVTTIAQVGRAHPYITKRLKRDASIEPFCQIPEGISIHRRQDREAAYFMTGAVYMRSRELILAENMDGHYLGKDARAVVVSEREATDINTPADFAFAEWLKTREEADERIVL